MSKHKYSLPWDVKQTCLWIVRGYERRAAWYREARREIESGRGAGYDTYIDQASGERMRQFRPRTAEPGRATEDKALRLERLENDPEVGRMRAVDHAAQCIGRDILNEELRQRLVRCIRQNCEDGRESPFEYLNLTEFSRTDFYRRKNQFLYFVACYLQLI